jgi:hypothetical protein
MRIAGCKMENDKYPKAWRKPMTKNLLFVFVAVAALSAGSNAVIAKLKSGPTDGRPRVIATSDGEIDDE